MALVRRRSEAAQPERIVETAVGPPRDPQPAEQAALGADLLNNNRVDTAELGELAKLPPFRPVALSLLRLFDRPQINVREIAAMVESDPTMASEMLAVVNSPSSRSGRRFRVLHTPSFCWAPNEPNRWPRPWRCAAWWPAVHACRLCGASGYTVSPPPPSRAISPWPSAPILNSRTSPRCYTIWAQRPAGRLPGALRAPGGSSI